MINVTGEDNRNNMKINSIVIKNFRGIRDIKLNLSGHSAVLFGINGAGKTSILDAICIIISRIIYEAALEDNQIDVMSITPSDIMLGTDETEINLNIEYGGDMYDVYRKRDISAIKKSKSISILANMVQRDIGVITDEDDNKRVEGNENSVPIFVNYGINRIDRRIVLFKKNITGEDKLDAWRDSICEGRIVQDKFYDWFRKRQELEYFNKINIDYNYADKQLQDVKTAILKALGDEYSDLIYQTGDNAGLYVKKGELILTSKQLSEGELNLVLLIGDISRRLSIANPTLEKSSLGNGVVLIDEIDSHIHPKWQERILDVLEDSFPNIQFVATTHAPKVLNSLDDNVRVISLENEKGYSVARELNPLNGWDVNDVLTRYMDTEVINSKTKELIDELHESLDNRDYERAQILVAELADKTDSTNIEVVRAGVVIGGNRTEIHK